MVRTTYKIDTMYFRGTINFKNKKFESFLLEKKKDKSLESTDKGTLIFQTDNLLDVSHLQSMINDVFKYNEKEQND